MPIVHLKQLHPNLYKAIRGHALTHLLVAACLAYAASQYTPIRPWAAVLFITLSTGIAITILYGLYTLHYRYIRYGLIAGLATITFLSFIFIISLPMLVSQEQMTRLLFLFPPWFYWAYQHYLCISEPPENPVSENL